MDDTPICNCAYESQTATRLEGGTCYTCVRCGRKTFVGDEHKDDRNLLTMLALCIVGACVLFSAIVIVRSM